VTDADFGVESVSGQHAYDEAGVYTLTFTVTDDDGGAGTSVHQFVVVYDPVGGFATGGGWIDSPAGAYTPDPELSGKASFGFVSKYRPGATAPEPEGRTQFRFKAGDLDFESEGYDWLVVNQGGSRAQFKGWGTINGTGAYRFLIWATDGSPDTFRIKIWWEEGTLENVVYDNLEEQAIGGGQIQVHR
jgi:PKD repeat protein